MPEDNPNTTMQPLHPMEPIQNDNNKKIKDRKRFKITRIFILVLISLSDMIVYFQRAVPTIVSEDMAKSYNVSVGDLSIFSSAFFYPYAVIQPFAGLLADVMDPRYLIGICSLIASIGGLICGLSNSLAVGSFGRVLVGIGSGPIYVPACRTIANWFALDQYSRATGIFSAVAGCGGLIAQGPFSFLLELIGWRWCFLVVSIVGFIMAILNLIFLRGNPISFGFEAVNSETNVDTASYSFKEKMQHLCQNFKTVMSKGSFWFVALYNFFTNGTFYNINGMWGGPYLSDVYGYSVTQKGNILMAISIGNVIGLLVIPFFAQLFNTRKWFVFWSSVLSTLCVTPFFLFVDQIPLPAIIFLFFVYAFFSNSLTNVAYPMCREYFHASASGTAVGCVNLTSFIATSVMQILTGKFLQKYFVDPTGHHDYTIKGYKYVLWMTSVLASIIGTIAITIAKDTPGPGKLSLCCKCSRENDQYQNIPKENELNPQSLMTVS